MSTFQYVQGFNIETCESTFHVYHIKVDEIEQKCQQNINNMDILLIIINLNLFKNCEIHIC